MCSYYLYTVDNIGLTCSVESMHTIAARRLSRRGTASRHHPHRTSSRRNKENGNGIGVHRNSIGRSSGSGNSSSAAHHDDLLRNQRKQRTVSFEQNQLQSPTAEYYGSELAAGRTTAGHWNEEAHSSHDIIYGSAIHSSMVEPTTSILNFMIHNKENETHHNSYQMNLPFIPPRL